MMFASLLALSAYAADNSQLVGKIVSTNEEPVAFATVIIKQTGQKTTTDETGTYRFNTPEGTYLLQVSALGFSPKQQKVVVTAGKQNSVVVVLTPTVKELAQVEVVSSAVSRIKKSAYNAVAVDAKSLHNTTMTLGDALIQVPGMKLRESGGVGSDMQMMMDGFGGRHVKVFIDGVPQEGVGRSFSLNNIPINFADRIEVYKGVVPVGFGTDALGGVINIVTGKHGKPWYLDASYSFGSFNTHKSYVNWGQRFKNGLVYEINLFQNYSDNNYTITTPVQIFNEDGTSEWDLSKIYKVKRFHDTYHNEAAVVKAGVVGKSWADRLMLGFTYSQMYKDIQTGITQDIVYGGKYRTSRAFMPSLEYRKSNLLVKNLDVVATVNYNYNLGQNVDTASYRYNWFGQYQKMRVAGEQSYQDNTLKNSNFNTTFTLNYRLAESHLLTFNNVYNGFRREIVTAEGVADGQKEKNAIPKITRKDIAGLSYRYMPNSRWNVSLFGKHYHQYTAGPVSAAPSGTTDFRSLANVVNAWGYGVAGTYFPWDGVQVKLSYEKAFRLPTNDELFGDEDLELGEIGLKPEHSDNLNLNLCYQHRWRVHHIYAELGLVYRDTKDFIQRSISGSYSGGKRFASYVNHGKVLTKGWNTTLRYTYKKIFTIGTNVSHIDTRDNVRTVMAGGNQQSVTYGVRMPNIPYFFFNTDASFTFRNVGSKNNNLTLTYDHLYVHNYSLYPENLGTVASRILIPSQFSHNISVDYSIAGGRFVLSLACKNLTDEALYDNFSLQKPGRAFYGKIRVYLSK